MEEEIVCNRERDLADERITITNIKISSSSFVISFLGMSLSTSHHQRKVHCDRSIVDDEIK